MGELMNEGNLEQGEGMNISVFFGFSLFLLG